MIWTRSFQSVTALFIWVIKGFMKKNLKNEVQQNVTSKYQPYPSSSFNATKSEEFEWYEDSEDESDIEEIGYQYQAEKKIVIPKEKKKSMKPKPKPKDATKPLKRKAVTAGPSPKKKANLGCTKGKGGETMFELSMMRYATVGKFHGKVLVGIREYYQEDGELLPCKKGISLSVDQWKRLQNQMKEIDKVVKELS